MSDDVKMISERDAVVAPEQIAANLRAWVHDLRVNIDTQGRESMVIRDTTIGDRYCCLGRAALVLGISDDVIDTQRPYGAVDKGMGLTPVDRVVCVQMNDGTGPYRDHPKSFTEIAHYIETTILPRYAPEPAAS